MLQGGLDDWAKIFDMTATRKFRDNPAIRRMQVVLG
jgi:hypothetical protein